MSDYWQKYVVKLKTGSFTIAGHYNRPTLTIELIVPTPPEWPKPREWYITNIGEPHIARSVQVVSVAQRYSETTGEYLGYYVKYSEGNNLHSTSLVTFQEACKEYYEWKRNASPVEQQSQQSD